MSTPHSHPPEQPGWGIGVVGCGEVTRTRHLPALRGLSDARVVAVTDLDPRAASAAAAAAPGARPVADLDELLSDRNVDAVLVATPPAEHEHPAVAALSSGRHVLCEKPLALETRACQAIAEAASAADRVVTVGFNLRHHPAIRTVRDAVANGTIGDPGLLQSRSTSGGRAGAGGWAADPASGGGVLAEQAIHHVDLWRFILGDELAEGRLVASGPELATVVGRTERGTLISAAFSWRTGPENLVAVFGPRARAAADLYAAEPAVLLGAGNTGSEPVARLRRGCRNLAALPRAVRALRAGGAFQATYVAQWRGFLDAAAGKGSNPAPARDGLLATETVLSLAGGGARPAPLPHEF